MADWLPALRADLDADLGRAPKVATLATVDGTPSVPVAEARSVVVRHIGDDGSLTFTSDGRSDKNAQLRANPSATLLFWLPKVKRQYRLAGPVAILPTADDCRRQQWQRMGDGARSLFLWPPPGQPRDDSAAFPAAVSADAAVPDTFEVLVLTPDRVESLDLSQHPHARHRWTRTDGQPWTDRLVNP